MTKKESGVSNQVDGSKQQPQYVSSIAMNVRELVECLVVALVLAFLIRTFEAEAFVIPTGSMATTLMGMHKDTPCPECHFPCLVNAADEEPSVRERRGSRDYENFITAWICPNCGYQSDYSDGGVEQEKGEKPPRSHMGDRVLVSKLPYQFGDPKRWDVAVFKFPHEAHTNYIKRITGVENETVRLQYGDLYSKPDGTDSFELQRKPPEKLLAMLQIVHDNNYLPASYKNHNWPPRWKEEPNADGTTLIVSEDGTSFSAPGQADQMAWIKYRHFLPTVAEWDRMVSSQPEAKLDFSKRRPQLINDLYGYNVYRKSTLNAATLKYGPSAMTPNCYYGAHWVGDLAVSCRLHVEQPTGQVKLMLIKGGFEFSCLLDLKQATATMEIAGESDFHPVAQGIAIDHQGDIDVMFSNVDRELRLWIDGQVVEFSEPTWYRALPNTVPTTKDLEPVRIGVQGSPDLRIENIRIMRDIYYIAQGEYGGPIDYIDPPNTSSQEAIVRFLSNPREWKAFERMRSREFHLGKGQYLALGDNSPCSADSRLWPSDEYYVDRTLIAGKAFFVYWPHSVDRIPGTNIFLPLCPNFPRMKFIR